MIEVYLLYFLSGVLKTFLIYFNINLPFDITMATGILLIFFVIGDLSLNGIKYKYSKSILTVSIFLLLFFVWILISLLYTESPSYSLKKAFLFITNLVAFFYPLLIKRFNVKKFILYLIITIPIISVFFFYIYLKLATVRDTNPMYYQIAGLYLSLSTISGIISVIVFTSKERIFKKSITNFIIGTLFFLIVLLSGARGPLFFTIISITLYFLYKLLFLKINFKINLKRIIINSVIFIPIILTGAIYFINKYYNKLEILLHRSIVRANLLISGFIENTDMGNSVDTRMDLMNFSFSKIFNNFSSFMGGYGIGSFGILYTGNDIREYPHNIILEIWFELGLIGVSIFLLFIIFNFFGKSKTSKYVSGFVLFFIVLNMLKSSSLVDIRIYFTFFALYLITYENKLNKNVI